VDLRKGKATVKLDNGVANLTLFSPYVVVGEKTYNVHYDVILYDGDLYAPIEGIISVFDRLLARELVYSPRERSINLLPARYNIVDLTAQQKMNGLLIELFVTERLKYDAVKTADNWLIFTLYGGKLDTLEFSGKRPIAAIYDTKAYQFENSAQISIRLRPTDFSFVTKSKDDPLRIQAMIKGEGFADTVLAYDPDSANDARDNLIDVIVIDPGHGGPDDRGAVGPSGAMEKDINLAISKSLRDSLESHGFTVILTRDDDRAVPLADRTSIANEARADLFISVHANASKNNKKARGFISFFLSDAKTDQARAAAALENSAIRYETGGSQTEYNSDLDFILMDMMQNEHLRESSDLAAMVEQDIQKHTDIESRGVDQAGFFVLNNAFMPAVLLECAFMSNKEDEKLLRSAKIQERIAAAIAESVMQFKQKYEAME